MSRRSSVLVVLLAFLIGAASSLRGQGVIPPRSTGSSLPEGGSNGDLLSLTEEFSNPTSANVLAEHPELVFTWTALTDPTYGTDVVVFVHGSTWVFGAEVLSGDVTGASEPTWSNANDPGETIIDGDITWKNLGLWSAFPPTPTTWAANHDYTPTVAPAFIYPTTPNGHLYIAYPAALTSDTSEPDFSSIVFADFIADNDGYWMDAGTDGSTPSTTAGWIAPGDVFTITTDLTLNSLTIGTGAVTIDVNGITIPTGRLSAIISGAPVVENLNAVFARAIRTGGSNSTYGVQGYANAQTAGVNGYYAGIYGGGESSIDLTSAQRLTGVTGEIALSSDADEDTTATFWAKSPSVTGTQSITNNFGVYVDNQLNSLITNSYAFWYEGGGGNCDTGGVFRVNALGILAYYNPCFTTYTPGATNFERIIARWGDTGVFGSDNIAYVGVEAGGGGSARVLQLIGGGLSFQSTLVAPASSGTRYLCISTTGVVTSSASACSGT